jgi:hypothetical protein
LNSTHHPTSLVIPLEVLGPRTFAVISPDLPSESKFQFSPCCTQFIAIVLSHRYPSVFFWNLNFDGSRCFAHHPSLGSLAITAWQPDSVPAFQCWGWSRMFLCTIRYV